MSRARAAARLLAGALALALAATGCIPARFSGYEPTSPGILETGYCVAWIDDRLLVEAPSGVGVHWRAFRDDVDDSILMDLYLTIPAGVTVRLRSPDLVLRSDSWSRAQVLPVEAITAPGPRTFGPDAELAGSNESSMGYFSFWFFTPRNGMWAQTGIPAVPEFSASLPPLLINGQLWESAPIGFREYSKWGMYTCLQ